MDKFFKISLLSWVFFVLGGFVLISFFDSEIAKLDAIFIYFVVCVSIYFVYALKSIFKEN